MTKLRQWWLLTAVAAFAVFGLGWVLLVSPQKQNAASLATQVSQQQSTNSSLQATVNMLQQEKKGVPAQQQALALFQQKVPQNDPQLPALIRSLQASATASGVDMVSLGKAPATAVTGSGQAGAAATSAGATSTATTTPTASGLYQVPVTISVSGSYFNIVQFQYTLENLTRAMRVTGLTLSAAGGAAGSGASTSAASSSSANAVGVGELTAQFTAVVFESLGTSTGTTN